MKILLLTFYFKPDLCAGSFRNTALAEAFSKHLKKEDHLDVVTTMPNRYSTFQADASEFEKYASNIHVYRSELPEHKSGFFDQINSFKAYYVSARKQVKDKDYDLVIASSSRLFTAFLGARVSSNKKAPLFLDMRDLFRENMQEIIKNRLINYPLDVFLSFIEKYTFNKADRINIVSEGFRDFFEKFDSPISFFPNGIDEVFLKNDFGKSMGEQSKRIITYAGNIGDGQGLHKIIPQTAKLLEDSDYIFRIIGDGGTRHLLEKEINELKSKNIELIDPVNRDSLLNYYKETDYLLLHLNDYDAFKKVLPSKIFEYAATGKPIIAGVGGYAKEFLREHVEGLLLFEPCNKNELYEALKSNVLPKDMVDRKDFINKFARSSIMNQMAEYILEIYQGKNE